ncbi:hypothetical protein PUN28_011251 [Cardiocondyla obscurior]|uniref:Uncharacterized protein n=1 Tax=Cardiocondyla obscurior TaxID=286306 RepID=A0AAW2FQY5_9HYME
MPTFRIDTQRGARSERRSHNINKPSLHRPVGGSLAYLSVPLLFSFFFFFSFLRSLGKRGHAETRMGDRDFQTANSIHQSGLDYAALVTERMRRREKERERERRREKRGVHVHVHMERFEGVEGAKEARIEVERNWPWSTLRLDAATAEGTKRARAWIEEEQRQARKKEGAKDRRRRKRGRERERAEGWRITERGETLLGFRSSNEEGGRSNAPRRRWLKAGCLSSFHLCLVPPRLSRTSFRPTRGLEAASSPNATMHISPKTPQQELSSLFLTLFLRSSPKRRNPAGECTRTRILALCYKRSRGWPWRAVAKLTEFSFFVKSFEVSVASVAPFVYLQNAKAQRTPLVQRGSDTYMYIGHENFDTQLFKTASDRITLKTYNFQMHERDLARYQY